ncbi:MAG: hypothetical protein CL672_00935 [Balneola sp.]|nr:hypothetical protein [Balneola sp.]
MIRKWIHIVAPPDSKLRLAKQLGISFILAGFFGLFAVSSTRVEAQLDVRVSSSGDEFRVVEGVRPSLLPLQNVRYTGVNPQGKKLLRAQLSSPTRPIWQQNRLLEPSRNPSPGLAFWSSALAPGSGQALLGYWGRTAIFATTEIAAWVFYSKRQQLAKYNESAYEQYGNTYWSPVAYAQWLVDYSKANNLVNGYEALDAMVGGLTPAFGETTQDWGKITEEAIRAVEVRTRFIFNIPEGCGSFEPPSCVTRSEFSHVLQNFGSQQYYELMSKYYQFQPGWQDFHEQRLAQGATHVYQYSWDATMLSERFIEGRDRAEEFNNQYRNAGNVLKLLLVNHMISAFDAYFSAKLRESRLQIQTGSVLSERAVALVWHF